jgi:hypothetical protein
VDPEAKTVEIHPLDPANEIPPCVFAERDTLASDLFPTLRLPLDSIWV